MQEQNNFGPIKQKLVLAIILVLSAGLLCSIGCTQMTRAEKNLCLSLTSQSYSYVPLCETEEECFKKTESLFKTRLGYYKESQLYSFKNSVARSWFFYNRALKQMKKINSLCESGNAKAISNEIYQLKFFLSSAFEESDTAIKKSFEIISYEENYLTTQKIDLLKEEKIFDSLLAFRQILTELKNGATNSETYVSFYASKIKQFNELVTSNQPQIIIEENQFWLKEGTQLQKDAKDFSESKNLFPFISPWIKKTFEYFEFNLYFKQNSAVLQKIPSSHTTKLYSDLFGENNSSLKRFADLISNLSQEYDVLRSKISLMHLEIQTQINSIDGIVEKIKDKDEFKALAQKITKTKIVAQEEINSRFETARANYFDLKEKNSQNTVSLGEEIFILKKIAAELNSIITELNFYDSIYFEKLAGACDDYANEALDITPPSLEELKELFGEIIFLSKKTISSSEKDKLIYCQRLYEKVEEYEAGKEDFELIESRAKSSAKKCIETTQLLIKYHTSPEIELLLKKLLDSDVKKETLVEFNESCIKINESLKKEIMADFEIIEIQKWFNIALDLEGKYNKASLYLGAEFAQTKEDFDSKIFYFKGFLNSDKSLNLEKVLPQKSQLLSSIKKFCFDFEKKLLSPVIKHIKDTAKSSLNSKSMIQADFDLNIEYTVVFYNPFWDITGPFQIGFGEQFDFIAYSDPNISNIILGKEVLLVFDYFPQGYCQTIFRKKERLQMAEKNTIIKASNKEGLIKKEITVIKNNALIDSIIIKIKKPSFYLSSIAVVNSKELLVQDTEKEMLSIKINNFFSEEKINFFINVSKIIDLKSVFLKNELTDFGEEANFEIQTKNILTQKVNADLIIEFLPDFTQPSEVYLYDSSENKVSFLIENDELVVKNQDFEAFESKTFFLKIFSPSTAASLKSLLLEQKEILYNEQKLEAAQKIGEFLDKPLIVLKEGFDLLEENKKIIDEINNVRILDQKNSVLKSEYQITLTTAQNICAEFKERLNKGLFSKCESIKQYLKDETEQSKLNKGIEFLENFLFEVRNYFLEKANSFWEKITVVDLNSPELSQIKESFFEEKTKLSKEFSTKNSLWGESYKRADALYASFVEEKNNLEKKNKVADANFKKSSRQLFLSVVKLLSWLEEELLAVDYENNPSNYLFPLSLSRIENINKTLFDFNELPFSEEEKIFVLKPIFEELSDLADSSKTRAIKEFNLGIDKKYDKSKLLAAKEFIDENKYIRAFFSLAKGKEESFFDPVWLTFFPFLVILGLAFFLKRFSKKKDSAANLQKKVILDSWDE